MRLNDREIREELRSQAMSVPIPDDMWAHIQRELDRDAAQAATQAAPAPRVTVRSSRKPQLRQVLAIGAAAGIFWMVVIPSGRYVDRFRQPSPNAAASAEVAMSTPDVPWDIPTEKLKPKERRSGRAGDDARRPAYENLSR